MRLVIILSAIRLSEATPNLESSSQTTVNYSPDLAETQVAVLWVLALAQTIPLSDSITTLNSHGRRPVLLTQFQTLLCGTLLATRALQTLTSEVVRIPTWEVLQAVFVAPIRATVAAKRLVTDLTNSQSLQILQGGIPKFYYHWALFHTFRP